MDQVISTEKIPIKLWLGDIEEGAMAQAKNLANLDFAFKHIAIMPDSHQGYGMPIGAVLATENVIIPNAVGVDIGCGMCAVKTSLTDIDTKTLKKIMGEIRKVVPVGFNRHKEAQENDFLFPGTVSEVMAREEGKIDKQIGTLGGGTHFIEIQKGDDDHIWIMIHSGSRNLGFSIANYYNKLAIEINEKWYSSVPKKWELAFLPTSSEEGKMYIHDMKVCVRFALANRGLMMERVVKVMTAETGMGIELEHSDSGMINIAHNYATVEHHFGKDVWVHRKGATLAREGTIGIIPGSMGTFSYIVEGLGNRDSFTSCSHGAGRRMGRRDAQRNLHLEMEQERMKGILGGPRSEKDLDEAPGAYKPIGEVMANQHDLVKIVTELRPLAVIKG